MKKTLDEIMEEGRVKLQAIEEDKRIKNEIKEAIRLAEYEMKYKLAQDALKTALGDLLAVLADWQWFDPDYPQFTLAIRAPGCLPVFMKMCMSNHNPGWLAYLDDEVVVPGVRIAVPFEYDGEIHEGWVEIMEHMGNGSSHSDECICLFKLRDVSVALALAEYRFNITQQAEQSNAEMLRILQEMMAAKNANHRPVTKELEYVPTLEDRATSLINMEELVTLVRDIATEVVKEKTY